MTINCTLKQKLVLTWNDIESSKKYIWVVPVICGFYLWTFTNWFVSPCDYLKWFLTGPVQSEAATVSVWGYANISPCVYALCWEDGFLSLWDEQLMRIFPGLSWCPAAGLNWELPPFSSVCVAPPICPRLCLHTDNSSPTDRRWVCFFLYLSQPIDNILIMHFDDFDGIDDTDDQKERDRESDS